MAAILPSAVAAVAAEAKYTFVSARQAGSVDAVTVDFEVTGNLLEMRDAKPQKVEVSQHFNLSFEEETLVAPTAASMAARSARRYQTAKVALKAADDATSHELPGEKRLQGCDVSADGTVVRFSPRLPLAREDLETVEVVGDPLVLERLLPSAAVAIGDHWQPDAAALAALLGIDKATSNDVQCTLTEVTDTVARFEIKGPLTGLVGDVTTEIELNGRYRFDVRTRRLDWIGLLEREKREISAIARGFEVVGRLQVRILPQASAGELTADEAAEVRTADLRGASMLRYLPEDGRWELVHDRRWFLNRDLSDMAIFRLIDQREYVGQCKIWPLPQRKPDDLPTIEAFQEDVRQALGDNYGTPLDVSQFAEGDNYRVFRVVVSGVVSDVPMTWRYYLVADQDGRQAALAFTYEDKKAEAFGEADRELLSGFRFLAADDSSAAAPPVTTESASEPTSAEKTGE